MIAFKEMPFCLSDEQVSWVHTVYNSMTLEEKIGQLFCPIVFTKEEEELKKLVQTKHDLVFYVGNVETTSNKTVARLNWYTMFGNPYHLLDVPH